MNDNDKSKETLIEEIAQLRHELEFPKPGEYS